jgi:transcriptional regulator with XRE-family HTH domain
LTVGRSFSGSVPNPIIDARLEMAMSANNLARRLGFSRQYLSRAEQGTYSSLNPALLRWVSNVSHVTIRTVEKRYEAFQKATRRATIERVNPHRLERHDNSPGAVLFERWRSGYWNSPTEFAVALCVHPDLVTKYEDGIQKTMPGVVFQALLEADLIDKNWVDEPSKVKALSAPETA